MGLENWSWLMSGEYSHWGHLFFLKKNIAEHISWHTLVSCPYGILGNPGFVVIQGSGVRSCSDFQAGVGGEEEELVRRQLGYTFQKHTAPWKFGFPSPFIFLRTRHISHSAAVFRDIWIYNVQAEVSSPLQSVKNSFFVHLFLSSTPSLNIFCKFILDNPRISVAGFGFTIYLACSVTLAETTNLIHDVNSKL